MKPLENMEKYLNEFNGQGYTLIPELVSQKQIQRIFHQIESILDVVIDIHKIQIPIGVGVDSKYMALKKQNPIIRSHVYDLIRVMNSIQEAIFSSMVIKLIEYILGTSTVFTDDTQVRIDDNSDDRLIELHQEVGLISIKNATLWCPLVDLHDDMKGLNILPGSHKNGFVPHRFYPEQHNYYCIDEDYPIDRSKIISPNCKAGDGIIFDGMLMHGSNPNKSKNIRWTLISRYNSLQGIPYLKDKNAQMHIPYTADYNYLIDS